MPLTIDLSDDVLTKLEELAGPDRSIEQVAEELLVDATATRQPSPPPTTIEEQEDLANREPWEAKLERLKKIMRPCGGNVSIDRKDWYPEVGR